MLETAGADRVLTMHLHAGQVQGFFQIPVDHLIARPMLTQYFLDKLVPEEYVAVSPDAGRAKLAEKFAGELRREARLHHQVRGRSTTSPRPATWSATSPARPRSSSTT